MFDDLKLHAQTSVLLAPLLERPAHGYLFSGPGGSGKKTVAMRLARHWSGGDRGLVSHIEPEKGIISIEAIRGLQPLLARQVSAPSRRVVIVSQADKMPVAAQNSLLKTLEEPLGRTIFILIADEATKLLPTIRSRLQEIRFHPLGETDLADWLSAAADISLEDAKRAYHLGGGTAGGMSRINENGEASQANLERAKQFLAGSPYDRIKFIGGIMSGEREQVLNFLEHISMVMGAALRSSVKRGDKTAARQVALKARHVVQARRELTAYVNQRLILCRLVVEL